MRNISSPLDGFASPFGRRRDLLSSTAIARLLFSNDEPGVFYDFDDWSTLFRDTAGTQPVTAANQGVALALDKRLKLELGPELVTNGTFDENIDGWTNATPSAGNISFSAGQLLVERVSGGTSAYQALACVVGYTYQVLFNFTSVVSGLPRISATSSASTPGSGVTDPQATRFVFVATATTMYIHLGLNSGNGTSGSYDNISVRELPGNHATQATTAARPLTVIHPDGGVRNLLDRSEEFDNAVWAKVRTSIVPNDTLAPDGTLSADKLVENTDANDHSANILTNTTSIGNICGSVFLKEAGRRYAIIRVTGSANGTPNRVDVVVDLQTGQITAQNGTILSATIEAAANGFYRVAVSCAQTTTTRADLQVFTWNSPNYTASPTYTGDGTSGIFVWGAQLELGSTATPYQKRVNFLDVTEAGKRSIRRLYFNGTSHFLQTPTITPNTDKAQVFAGVRKLSEGGGTGAVLETSTTTESNNGSLLIVTPTGFASNSLNTRSRGTISRDVFLINSFPAPISGVVSMLSDIAAPLLAQRINGTQAAQSTDTQGTGNYLAYPMFIGARNGTSLFFNGYIDQLITRFGTNLTTGAIETTEKYVSTKSPEVTL
jgi:hypothetical protein